MELKDFDYHLPTAQIAQRPLDRRDASRLMRLVDGRLEHHTFSELPTLLKAGDLLVLNDAAVIPARLLGKKTATGGKVELLLIRPGAGTAEQAMQRPADGMEWHCLGQASKGLNPGAKLSFDHGLEAEVLDALGGGEYRVRLTAAGNLGEVLAQAGKLPLPPYIERAAEAGDDDRYQTVYARHQGSVAAPTAGLHFTPALFEQLAARGIRTAFITLDVGPGTFMPVRDENIAQHQMHAERCVLSESTAEQIRAAKREGRRVVAVGTTVVRTLESLATDDGAVVRAGELNTQLFITPGFTFRVIDAMVTNFHLPKSTLVMLVSAFVGREKILAAYATAVEQGYRFFSYGDAMLLEDRI